MKFKPHLLSLAARSGPLLQSLDHHRAVVANDSILFPGRSNYVAPPLTGDLVERARVPALQLNPDRDR
jgi:hypothetical protein